MKHPFSSAITGLIVCMLLLPAGAGLCFTLSADIILDRGGRVDWYREGDERIAVDIRGADGYYDVHTMNVDGSGMESITDGNPFLWDHHNGNPAWHPGGEFLVIQSEDETRPELPNQKIWATPGRGLHNSLWFIRPDGSEAWKVYRIPFGQGLLHPHFSEDGRFLTWSETEEGFLGGWVIKVAFVKNSGPRPELGKTRTYFVGEQPAFIEAHGFSPDGGKVLFSGNLLSGQPRSGMDIWHVDLETQELERLTETFREWDEHSHYSPDGEKIVWMSSSEIDQIILPSGARTDYWIMNPDGTNKRRVTFFNDPDSPGYIPWGVTASDHSWGPGGLCNMAYIMPYQDDRGRNVLFQLIN